jgi:hypothetical protein
MATGSRSKITPETQEEARRLRELWKAQPRPTQAQFGHDYEIGNQSAVGQFLRGEVVLSLKAARGFARGLGCRLEDFSPRLAAEAAAIAGSVTPTGLSPEVAELARAIEALEPDARADVLKVCQMAVDLRVKRNSQTEVDLPQQRRKHG